MNIKKTIPYFLLSITGFVCAAVITFCYFYVPNPLKVTNPYHQWFKPDNFRFEDYMVNRCIIKETLAKLFPVGSDKAFVERVLVKAGGANPTKLPTHVGKGDNAYSYFYTPMHWSNYFFPHTFNVSVTYNKHDIVESVSIGGSSRDPEVHTYYQDCRLGKDYGGNWK